MSGPKVHVEAVGLRANATQADTCPFVLSGAAHAESRDATAALTDAMARANRRAQADLLDRDGHAPSGDRPALIAAGPSATAAGDDVDLVLAWFAMVAEELEAAGWSGRLEAVPWASARPAVVDAVEMSAVLAVSGWWSRTPGAAAFPVWRTSSEPAGWLARLASSWVQGIDGLDSLHVVSPETDVPAGQLETLLRLALADQQQRAFMTVRRTGPTRSRTARFTSRGHVILSERAPGPPSSRLGAFSAAVVPWAAECDYAYVAGSDPLPEQLVAERGREPLPEYYRGFRHADQERLPDAFGWQLVTSRHVANARDVSEWQLEEVALDRFALAHPEPDRWFVPVLGNAREARPDPAVLRRARDAFGPLVLGQAQVEDLT